MAKRRIGKVWKVGSKRFRYRYSGRWSQWKMLQFRHKGKWRDHTGVWLPTRRGEFRRKYQ